MIDSVTFEYFLKTFYLHKLIERMTIESAGCLPKKCNKRKSQETPIKIIDGRIFMKGMKQMSLRFTKIPFVVKVCESFELKEFFLILRFNESQKFSL